MPLHDHFRGPLAVTRHWTAFHGAWATYIAEDLNERLLPGYFAEALVQFGVEIAVAAWEEPEGEPGRRATPAEGWSPPAPKLTVPFVAGTDQVEVLVYRQDGGPSSPGRSNSSAPPTRTGQPRATRSSRNAPPTCTRGQGW